MKIRFRVNLLWGAVIAAIFSAGAAQAQITLSFDVDGAGNALSAPIDFAGTTALSDRYAALGVTFSGPSFGDGAAILSAIDIGDPTDPGDDFPTFGIDARSGANFLAFNSSQAVSLADGHHPTGPESITFAAPVSSASLFVSGGFLTGAFTLQAFDAANNLLDSSSAAGSLGNYSELRVASLLGIQRLTLTGSGANAFVLDDFTFTPLAPTQAVPEPGAFLLLGATLPFAAHFLRRRRRASCR